MRINWNPAANVSVLMRGAIERDLGKRTHACAAFVDEGGSFVVVPHGDTDPDLDSWRCVAESEAGAADPTDALRDSVDGLQLALRDRNATIDRLIEARDGALADLTSARTELKACRDDLAAANQMITEYTNHTK